VTKLAPATRDLVSIVVVGLAAFVVAAMLDLNDELVDWTRVHPDLEWLGVDELPVAFALIGLGMGWYAFRRWREHKGESVAHRRTLSQLQQAMDEVVAANQAKSQFLAAMSHELRTPLNAILGFSEIIRDEAIGPAVGERYRDYANDIHSAGTHLLSIVNDILDMARSEAGSLNFETVPIEAAEIIDLVRRIVTPRARSGGVEIRIRGQFRTIMEDWPESRWRWTDGCRMPHEGARHRVCLQRPKQPLRCRLIVTAVA